MGVLLLSNHIDNIFKIMQNLYVVYFAHVRNDVFHDVLFVLVIHAIPVLIDVLSQQDRGELANSRLLSLILRITGYIEEDSMVILKSHVLRLRVLLVLS